METIWVLVLWWAGSLFCRYWLDIFLHVKKAIRLYFCLNIANTHFYLQIVLNFCYIKNKVWYVMTWFGIVRCGVVWLLLIHIIPYIFIYRYTTQKSLPVYLMKGKQYYMEAIMKDDHQEDHLEVGLQTPDGQFYKVIPSMFLWTTRRVTSSKYL